MATGTESSSSTTSPATNPAATPAENPPGNEAALRDYLKRRKRLDLGIAAAGLKSVLRGLGWEHRQVERDSERCNQLTDRVLGTQTGDAHPEADDMGDIFLGDITIQPPPAPVEPPSAPPATPDPPKRLSRLVKAAIAAALIASGAGLGASLPWLVGTLQSTPAASKDRTRRIIIEPFEPPAAADPASGG